MWETRLQGRRVKDAYIRTAKGFQKIRDFYSVTADGPRRWLKYWRFQFQVLVPNGSTAAGFHARFYCGGRFLIDWGDGGTWETVPAGASAKHLYGGGGSYTVTVLGTSADMELEVKEDIAFLTPVPAAIDAFICNSGNGKGPHELPEGFLDLCSKLERLQFSGVPLATLRTGLLEHCTALVRCNFNQCPIAAIPAGLFDCCGGLTFCRFRESAITEIPAGLFDRCPHLTSMNETFRRCASLRSIPPGLFTHCAEVTVFDSVFAGCSALRSIPPDLFAHCAKANSFYNAFAGCGALTGEAPKLWELFPDAFGMDCFYGCTGLDNYSAIPDSWK